MLNKLKGENSSWPSEFLSPYLLSTYSLAKFRTGPLGMSVDRNN